MKYSLLTNIQSRQIIRLVGKNTNRLKVLRAGRGLSQLDTSIKSGIKEYRYWRIENGYEVPTPDERATLAKLFDVAESEVFIDQVSA